MVFEVFGDIFEVGKHEERIQSNREDPIVRYKELDLGSGQEQALEESHSVQRTVVS